MPFLSIFDTISLMLTFGIFLIALLTYIRSDKK
ncbi:putative holin-like toxin [Companilactobacillus muriivasis]